MCCSCSLWKYLSKYPQLMVEVRCVYVLSFRRAQSIIQSCVFAGQSPPFHTVWSDQKEIQTCCQTTFFKMGTENSESLVHYHNKVVCYICLLCVWGIFILIFIPFVFHHVALITGSVSISEAVSVAGDFADTDLLSLYFRMKSISPFS